MNQRSGHEFTVIGVDVGGTKIAAGIIRFPQAELLACSRIPTDPERDGEAILADTCNLIERLAGEAQAKGLRVDAIGIGICELVSPEGEVISSNCVPWRRASIAARLAVPAPFIIEADVRAAALAEAQFGAGRSLKNFLYVTVGTGISCCLVLDGRPFLGTRGATGTMASSPLTMTCNHCGQRVNHTLEEIASGPALVARFNARRQPSKIASAEDLINLASGGDADAVDVLQSAGEALGVSVGLLVNVLDPEAVIVGGGLGVSGGMYWESFEASTRAHIWSDVHRALPIVPAEKGRDAGVIGAGVAAWREFRKEN
jgi:glucokinase